VRIIDPEEECLSVVPLQFLTPSDVKEGQYELLWPEDGQTYAAFVIVRGKLADLCTCNLFSFITFVKQLLQKKHKLWPFLFC